MKHNPDISFPYSIEIIFIDKFFYIQAIELVVFNFW